MKGSLRVQKLVQTLVEGEEDLFTQGLLNELDTRKEDLCKQLSIKIFEHLGTPIVNKEIKINEDIQNFIKMVEKFDNNSVIKVNFKNESILNISENEIEPIKRLFDSLNEENQKVLARDLFKTPQHFKQTVEFAKKVKGLFS
jgi:hypothetical protein